MKQATKSLTFAMLAALAAFCAHAEITTGWLPTAAGTYTFTDSANWANGDVNGVFSADWTPGANMTINFTDNWTGSFSFLGNITKNVTFQGSGGTKTIYLTDDFVIQPATSGGQIIFNNSVNLDLGGGTRRFRLYSPSTPDKFRFNGAIVNGDAIIEGSAGISLFNAASFSGNVKVCENSSVAINYATANSTVRRAEDVELCRGTIAVAAYNGNDTAEFGKIIVNGSEVPGVSILTSSDNGRSHVSILAADSLTITNGGTLTVLVDAPGASADAVSAGRIKFTETPILVGSGLAGSTSAPVVPGVIILASVTGSGRASAQLPTGTINKSETYNTLSFSTYDDTIGLRPLSSNEIATAPDENTPVNLVVESGSPLVLDSAASVNSLQLQASQYRDDVPQISGDARLKVKSGMVLAMAVKNGVNIAVPLDFENVTGHIVAAGPVGEQVNIGKPVYGSAGLVLTRSLQTSAGLCVAPSSSARGFVVTAKDEVGAYTGDTYIQCVVDVGSCSFLPHGTRAGNVIVNGSLNFGSISINGLYGVGAVRGATLAVGEDGSDSSFAGTAVLTSALNVTGGNFVLDGTVTQGAVNVASGAAIGGNGLIETTLTFADGAKFDVDVADDVASCLDVAGDVTGGHVTVDVDVTSGKWRTAQCVLRSNVAITATFKRGAGVGALELRNNGTELWASPKVSGFMIVVR